MPNKLMEIIFSFFLLIILSALPSPLKAIELEPSISNASPPSPNFARNVQSILDKKCGQLIRPHQAMFDSIVIGAGVMGSSTAYNLALRGQKTLVLEQFSLGHSLGSSHGHSRFFRFTHSDELWMPLIMDAHKEWENLEREYGKGPNFLIVRNGLLTMDVNETKTRKRAEILAKWGIEHEMLESGQKIGQKFAHLKGYNSSWSGVYENGAFTMLADNIVRAFQELFLKKGSANGNQIHQNEQVLDVQVENSVLNPIIRVTTNKGNYTTRNLVITVGGWLSTFLPNLPLRVRPQLKGLNFGAIQSNPQHFDPFHPKMPSPNLEIVAEEGAEFTMVPGIDFPGVAKFAIHLGRDLNDISNCSERRFEEWMWTGVAQHFAEHIPDLDPTPILQYTCIYTMTDDALFILDRHPSHPNVFIAGGFSGSGFKFSPTIGKLMAQMASGEPSQFDLTPFRMKRFIPNKVNGLL